LALLNVVACFCAPQQIILAVLPLVREWRARGLRAAARYFSVYAGIVVALFVLPFLLLTMASSEQGLDVEKGAFAYRELTKWSNPTNLIGGASWFVTGSVFFVFSEFIPAIELTAFAPLTAESLVHARPITYVLAIVVIAYALAGFRAARNSRGPNDRIALGVFCGAYLTFFVFYNPGDAFLHASPFVLPFWLLLHSAFVARQDTRSWRTAMFAMCLAAILNNGILLAKARREDPQHKRVATIENQGAAAYGRFRSVLPVEV